MTSGPSGPGDPRPPDEGPQPTDPAAVTAPYTPPTATPSTGEAAPATTPPPPPAAPGGGTGLPPGVGWAPAVPVRQEIAPGLALSNTFPRLAAWIVDGFLLTVLYLVVGEILVAVGLSRPVPQPQFDTTGAIDYSTYFVFDPVAAVLNVVVSAAYFIASWSGGRRATLGQRLLKIQVGNAFDGRALSLEQAIRRWIGLGEPITLLGVLPGLAGLGGFLWFAWALVLLITTATSPTKQGLHDRLANSAVVRPVDAGSGLVMACAVIAVILAAIALLSIVALIFLGSQVSSILSQVGESV
jgi:uncharacterized RDD family membrane protein YckC